MNKPSLAAVFLLGVSIAVAQQSPPPTEPADTAKAVPVEETPERLPPASTVDANGKSLPPPGEKRVLADPATKLYMPCRDPNDAKSSDDDASRIKPNPKASVLSEEAAKQHGYKPSPHKIDCPTP